MSKLSTEKIDELATLARLGFGNEEKKNILKDLEQILNFCQKLTKVDTEGLDPLIYLNENEHPIRKDTAEISLDKSKMLENAPMADSDYVKVPKVK